MDEKPTEKPAEGLNKIDLSQLQGFSFGTQWTQDAGNRGGAGGGSGHRDHQRRDDRPRRDGGGGPADPRRDRRGFRKPGGDAAPGESAPGGDRPPHPRREFREPRRDGQPGGGRGPGQGPAQGQGYGGQRRDFRGGGHRREGGGSPFPIQDRGPYISPYFDITLYTEDGGFSALAKAVRASCRTYELFDIARVVVEKNDRFIAVVQRKAPSPAPASAEGTSVPPVKPAPFYISVPDGLPFDNEEDAIQHVLTHHLDRFFETSEVEIDPPKGSFQVINRCPLTGTLLAPPNYHRYNQIVQKHHAAHIRMPLEAWRAKIETVRDPELINQWLDLMKKVTRYTWKLTGKHAAPGAAPAEPAGEAASSDPQPAAAPTADDTPANPPATEAPAEVAAATDDVASPAPAPEAEAPVEAAAAPTPEAPSFDSLEEARQYLLTHAREKVLRTTGQLRFPGRLLETLPQGEIRRALEGYLEKQRRFPLDTANALRGRLRREGFTIFKKGSKGISYVCAVKRKFRVPGQTFADSIDGLIRYIEEHPMIRQSDLPKKFLGIHLPAPAPASEAAPAAAAGAEGEATPATASAPAEGAPPEPAAPALPPEDQARINRMQMDLRWLVGEGYVTEFRDGRLFAPPPMVEARKKEIEGGEHDPENFPEAPAQTPPPAPASATREESPAAATAAAPEAESTPESAEQPEASPPPETPAETAEPAAAADTPAADTATAEADPEAGEADKPASGS
ncbi:hypothetical protein OPIT5_30460 [Opitutaceae bacterium TAV5]|nr:hypothetical protein OPIT5_30460 [Opitutaceae bacterium TAV5]